MAGVAIATIAGIIVFVTILIAYPNLESKFAQLNYSHIPAALLMVYVTLIMTTLVVTAGFLIREIPKAVSDVLFTVAYIRSSGWTSKMQKEEKLNVEHSSSFFSGTSLTVFLVFSMFLTAIMLLFDPVDFFGLVGYFVIFSTEEEAIHAIRTVGNVAFLIIFTSLAIFVLRIFPEIFNDVYGWHSKKYGGMNQRA